MNTKKLLRMYYIHSYIDYTRYALYLRHRASKHRFERKKLQKRRLLRKFAFKKYKSSNLDAFG